jgi:hypothetical protein
MKSVTFNTVKEVRYIPVESENMAKLIFSEKQPRSFARVDLEIKRRRSEAIKNEKHTMKTIRHNIQVIDETLKSDLITEDVKYFKNLRNDAIFDLRQCCLKINYYRHTITS